MLQRGAITALFLVCAGVLAGCGSSTAKPAATVNGRDISMSAYTHQIYYKRQVTVDSGGVDQCQPGSPAATCGQLKSGALTDLIDNELVNQYASAHHITVSNADFNREWSQIWRVRFQRNPALLKAFSQRMRISQSDIKARVREDMMRQAVLDHVVSLLPATVPALRAARMFANTKAQADSIALKLRNHTPFLAVAALLATRKASPCSVQGTCGDSGWVPIALLQPFERFLVKEPLNKVLGPFKLQQGYEFYLVEGRTLHLQTTANQQIALRGLAFSKWLVAQERHAKIMRNVAA